MVIRELEEAQFLGSFPARGESGLKTTRERLSASVNCEGSFRHPSCPNPKALPCFSDRRHRRGPGNLSIPDWRNGKEGLDVL